MKRKTLNFIISVCLLFVFQFVSLIKSDPGIESLKNRILIGSNSFKNELRLANERLDSTNRDLIRNQLENLKRRFPTGLTRFAIDQTSNKLSSIEEKTSKEIQFLLNVKSRFNALVELRINQFLRSTSGDFNSLKFNLEELIQNDLDLIENELVAVLNQKLERFSNELNFLEDQLLGQAEQKFRERNQNSFYALVTQIFDYLNLELNNNQIRFLNDIYRRFRSAETSQLNQLNLFSPLNVRTSIALGPVSRSGIIRTPENRSSNISGVNSSKQSSIQSTTSTRATTTTTNNNQALIKKPTLQRRPSTTSTTTRRSFLSNRPSSSITQSTTRITTTRITTTRVTTTSTPPTSTTPIGTTPPSIANSINSINSSELFNLNAYCGNSTVAPRSSLSISRIIGGFESTPHSFPWQAFVSNGRFLCGGSLINNEWVLTAAHCVQQIKNASTLFVLLGAHRINVNEQTQRKIFASKITIHESYNPLTVKNDIALVKLSERVEFNNFISPVCLSDEKATVGTRATVSGWGITESGATSDVLKQVSITLRNLAECNVTQSGALCAGDGILFQGNSNKDSCSGDSGGPLVIVKNNLYYQIGVVSYGYAVNGDPCPGMGIYTDVFAYKDWIWSNLNLN